MNAPAARSRARVKLPRIRSGLPAGVAAARMKSGRARSRQAGGNLEARWPSGAKTVSTCLIGQETSAGTAPWPIDRVRRAGSIWGLDGRPHELPCSCHVRQLDERIQGGFLDGGPLAQASNDEEGLGGAQSPCWSSRRSGRAGSGARAVRVPPAVPRPRSALPAHARDVARSLAPALSPRGARAGHKAS